MTQNEAFSLIDSSMKRMSALYGGTLFDEWALVRIGVRPPQVALYSGPRPADFSRDFARDLVPLEMEMADRSHAIGDFDFARAAAGTHFDAVLRSGVDSFLICNNTVLSMDQIRANPLWLKAQVLFIALCDKLRADPVDLG